MDAKEPVEPPRCNVCDGRTCPHGVALGEGCRSCPDVVAQVEPPAPVPDKCAACGCLRHEHDYLRDVAATMEAELNGLRARLAAAERARDEAVESVWKTVCAACHQYLGAGACYDESPDEMIYRIGDQRDEFQQRAEEAERRVEALTAALRDVRSNATGSYVGERSLSEIVRIVDRALATPLEEDR